MKYYYGNSYKEAVSNAPVEIKSTRTLQQYQEVYNVVIPVTDEDEYDEYEEDDEDDEYDEDEEDEDDEYDEDEEDEEQFYMLVWKEKGSNEELSERYDDFDDVRADFKYVTEQTPEEYEYVVMQKVTESQIDGETIEELARWGLE